MKPYYSHTHKLSVVFDKVAKPCLKQQGGYYFAQLLLDWEKIVGDFAKDTLPLKLIFPKGQGFGAHLTLQVNPGAALIIGFQQGIILEKITLFYGKRLVDKLSFIQKSIAKLSPTVKTNKPIKSLPQNIIDKLTSIQDEALRQALERLGENIL